MADDHLSDADSDNDEPSASGSLLASDEYESSVDDEKPRYYTGRYGYLYENLLSGLRSYGQWIIPIACVLAGVILTILFRPNACITREPDPVTVAHPSISGFSGPRNELTFLNGTRWVQPPDIKVVGIIFFGRRQFVKTLECYLRRNLKINGGMLDEVHFLLHTKERADIKWLKRLIKREGIQHYKLKNDNQEADVFKGNWSTFRMLYKQHMTDLNTIYIKIDDDVLFIDDFAISELLRVTLEHPEAHNVQANIINNRFNQWHQMQNNAIWPYLPAKGHSGKPSSWRPSELPRYSGAIPPKDFKFNRAYKPPNKEHRWLPLEPTYENFRRTPFGHNIRSQKGIIRKDERSGWSLAAQTHYSFFENFERRELMRFNYGSDDDYTWNQWFIRYNINMFAVRGSHIVLEPTVWGDTFKRHGDEPLLTTNIPRALDMPVLIATRAIAAHFSFKPDRAAILQTDILDRYEALANEFYCAGGEMHDPDETGREDIGDGPQDIINPEDDDDGEDDEDEEEG